MPSMKMGLRKGYAVRFKEGIIFVNVRELYGGEWFKTISPSFYLKFNRKEGKILKQSMMSKGESKNYRISDPGDIDCVL